MYDLGVLPPEVQDTRWLLIGMWSEQVLRSLRNVGASIGCHHHIGLLQCSVRWNIILLVQEWKARQLAALKLSEQ
jgi:hypothetical protein